MALPNALLLDLDDTILDTYGNPDDVWRRLCREFADRLGAVTPGQLHGATVEPREWFWADAGRARRGRLDLREARRQVVRGTFERLCLPALRTAVELDNRFTVVREEAVKPLPGAIETLPAASGGGCPPGSAHQWSVPESTPKDRTVQPRPFLRPHPDRGRVRGREAGRASLPACARSAGRGAEALGVGPTEAWMVGDNLEHDIVDAQRVGIYGVWVDAHGDGLLDGLAIRPDRTIGALPICWRDVGCKHEGPESGSRVGVAP